MAKKLNSRPSERRAASRTATSSPPPRATAVGRHVSREDVAEAMQRTLAAAERRLKR